MTYLALVHGAKGIIYWVHTGSKYYIHDYPEHWEALKKIAGELRDLSPVLMTPDSKLQIETVPESATIDLMVKEARGEVYVFAVNREQKPCMAHFRVKDFMPSNQVDVAFEGRMLRFSDTLAWTDDFAPLGVHVYHFRGARR